MESFLAFLVYFFLAYLLIGAVFALAFVTKGVGRVDESAEDTSWRFRLLIWPGSVAFWPWLLAKWIKSNKKHGHFS